MDLSCDDSFLAVGTDLVSEDAWVLLYDLGKNRSPYLLLCRRLD